jgi:8-oxo-dGTP diphosphatase
MESEHFVGKVSLRAVIEKDGKILVSHSAGDPWEFPGGRLHKNEAPTDGIAREIKEELGATFKPDGIFYTEQWMHVKTNTPQLFLFFRGSLSDEPRLVNPEEVGEFRWVSRGELKDLLMWDDCRRAADEFLRLIEK